MPSSQEGTDATGAGQDPADAVRRRVEYLLGAELSGSWNADQQLGWAGIMEVARLLPGLHDREMMEKHGLSLTLLSVLGRLDEGDRAGLQARELAIDLRLSPGRMSRHIATLEDGGLVTKRHNADDGRAMDIRLTRAGRARLAGARQTALEIVERDFMAHVSPAEMEVLARVAVRILREAERRPQNAGPQT